MTETIATRLHQIEARIAQACGDAGRDRASVRLLGASKAHAPAELLEAHAAGLKLMGENRGQELRDKARGLPATIEWHFIGPVQKNKVKYIVGTASMVHTIGHVDLARALGQRVLGDRGRGQDLEDLQVLVEVNLGGEASKHGVAPADCLALCHEVTAVEGVALRGLMAIPPYEEDPQDSAPWFEQLAALAAKGRAEGLDLVELSMGMSGDFEVAIAHGATLVRVGTAIFGERQG